MGEYDYDFDNKNTGEELLKYAQHRQIDMDLARKAIIELNLDSIKILVTEFGEKIQYFIDVEVVHHILNHLDSCTLEKAVDILEVLIDTPSEADVTAIYELGYYPTPKSIQLLREKLNSHRERLQIPASKAIINAIYNGNPEQALRDESDFVLFTACKQLQEREDRRALITALSSHSTRARRLSAWYMGRRQVEEAIQPLIDRLEIEDDTEALRACIWSLGNLRTMIAKPHLKKCALHDKLLIRQTAIEALSKINRAQDGETT